MPSKGRKRLDAIVEDLKQIVDSEYWMVRSSMGLWVKIRDNCVDECVVGTKKADVDERGLCGWKKARRSEIMDGWERRQLIQPKTSMLYRGRSMMNGHNGQAQRAFWKTALSMLSISTVRANGRNTWWAGAVKIH